MNLPNKLTGSRLIMTMIFVGFAAVPVTHQDHLLYWRIAYILAIIAGFTDFFDGYLARRLNQVTSFGKLMDPLADKIFTVSCFVILTAYGLVPFWITVLILAREFAVSGLRTLAANKGQVIAARDIGKLKTVLQMLALAFGGCFWIEWVDKDKLIFRYIWPAILYSIVIVTVYSGLEYFWKSRHLYMKDS